MTRLVLVSSWLADNDYKDCWLNFPLHPGLQKYCGIIIGVLFPEMKRFDAQMMIAVWIRIAIGLSNSPYNSIQSVLYAKQLVMGDKKDRENPLHRERIEDNLPFLAAYKALLPKLTKICVNGGHGSEIVVYVDNVRIIACLEDLAWKASSRVAKELYWLGLQDAERKERRASKQPGAWAGAIVATDNRKVTKSVTEER